MTDQEELSPKMRAQLQDLIAKGVDQSFRDIGLNQAEVYELRKDLTFLREQRLLCEQLRSRGLIYIMITLITAIVALITIGIRGWLYV